MNRPERLSAAFVDKVDRSAGTRTGREATG